MFRDRSFIVFSLTLVILLFACSSAQKNSDPVADPEVQNTIEQARDLYYQAEFEDAVIKTSSLLATKELSPEQEKDALLVLAMSEVNRGQENEARAYLSRLADLDPTVELTPDDYPPQMMRIWYQVEGEIPDEKRPKSDMETIAVMYFDNMSISDDQEKLEPLSKGLMAMMIQDISKTDKLRVVERDRINFLLDELKLQQSDLTDKSTAVKMGKLVGAQTLLMGGFMKLDKNNFKIYGRLVSVETSEIIKAEEVEGDPDDIFELQKELVFKILDDLKVDVDKNTKDVIEQGKDAKYEALYHYSLGLALQDKNDYAGAFAEYRKALEISPGYAEAEEQMDRLRPLAMEG